MSRRPVAGNPVCDCGSGRHYDDCCGPWHAGRPAPTPEALMRSRYSAYVRGMADYLLATWDPSTRPTALDLDEGVRWLGLKILRAGKAADGHDIVEFVARYRSGGGRAVRLHETSRFVHTGGRWYYLDGSFAADPQAG